MTQYSTSMRRAAFFLSAAIASSTLPADFIEAEARGVRNFKTTAQYSIRWNGLSVGTFSFSSSVNGQEYSLSGSANIGDVDIGLMTLPVYSWKAQTKSEGSISGGGAPMPSSYSFNADNQSENKKERIALTFSDRTVNQISVNPPAKSSSKRVPILPEHLRNVIDPLSAVVTLSYGGTDKKKSACDKRLPIFDGKVRYDLTFSHKTTNDLDENGYKGKAYVCRVRFTAIAGHKDDKKDKEFQRASQNVEVWMVPFAEADLMVPYKIVVPSANASMTLTKFDVQLPSQARKTLMN